ncbi:hypothetical protein CHS0354_008782 [Potamilus streckersoni]|uniref:VPS9 domain-containing protein n=1 Tax=Potamilus streckersoni TaxID=2493646 RepID=A0AAE0SNW3_9BIVA|nr:hypothetical protein CHS0354_008782 [Potamilus streckersoni]
MDKEKEKESPEEKRLYVWQGFHGKIELVSFSILNTRTVLQVALGGEHSLFLTDTDEVYSCGSNKSRQLGVASLDVQYSFDPCLVQDVSGKHVTHIACGSCHSACVCSDGHVFTWGDSKSGQCGLDIKDAVVTSPSLVDLTNVRELCEGEGGHTHIIQVACGATHTLALTKEGEVIVWGSGCQLGLGSEKLFSKPTIIPGLEGRRVLKVYCGDFHSALLVEKSDLPIPKSPNKRVSKLDTPSRKSSPSLMPHNSGRKISSGSNEVVDRRTQSSEDLSSHHEETGRTISVSKTNIQEIEQRDSEPASDKSLQPVSDGSKEKYGNEPLEPVISETNQKDINDEGISQIALSAMLDSDKGDSETIPDSKTYQIIPSVEQSLNSKSAIEVSGRDERSVEDQSGQGSNMETNASELDSKASENEESAPLICTVSRSRSFLDEEQARKYLAKQFETDEFEVSEKSSCKSLEKTTKSNASFPPSILGSGVFGQVTSLTSHMTSQVSSMTSKAFSTLKSTVTGTLSVGGTTGGVEKSPRKSSGENYDILADLELKAIDSLNESDLDISLVGVTASANEDASGTETELTSLVEGTTESLDVSTNIDRRKSCSLRTLEVREEQLRKKSVPSITGDLPFTVNADIGVIETEVWSWGKNTKGQLGLGDMIDRCEPCCIRMLTEKQIVKLGLGSQHTLALTARGEVYSWGLNNSGQLGHAEMSSTAFKIKLGPGLSVWDIAAGDTHSILLVDNQSDPTARPDAYYIGKHPTKDLYVPVFKTQKPIQLNFARKAGWISSLESGGDNCACIAFGGSKRSQVTFDFARWHRQFYLHLDMIERLLLKPLQNSKFYTELVNCPHKTMLEDVISAFKMLCQKVGQASSQLAECIRESKNIFGASVFTKFEILIDSLKKYSTAFSDMLATGGFEFYGKNGSSTFEKMQQSFRILLKKDKLDSPSYAVIFKETLQFPLIKMSEYSKLLAGFADLYPKDSKENDLLSCLALNWEHLDRISNTELGIADNTRCFWETCPSKFTTDYMYGYFHSTQTFVTTTDTQLDKPKENLQTATRRLLRESKTHPLTLQSSGRFSTHVFYLFTDVFVHYQNSTSQVYPLEMVWIETPTDSDSQKNLLIMKTPEETLTLSAPSSAGKVEWLMSLNSAISKVLADHKPLPESRHTSSDRLTPPVIRHGTHTFTKPGPNKDAVYTGYWISGTMHGMGQMKYSDGRCYKGKFKNGQQTGYGRLNQPIGDKSEDVLEGTWKNCKLHGFGMIRYGNGDLYEGYFKEGRKWGHGTYRKGRKLTSASFIYIGEWIADKKHGYGVMDDILKGEKYMGMWQEDNRHGDGIVVTLDGMYFEGNFQAGKMSGFGLMVTDDSSIYEGEFSGITQLQGKGTLTFPNGDKIEGAFTGSWNEGLKINGSFIKCSITKSISSTSSADTKSSYFGKLSVRPDRKWDELFYHCHTTLHYNRDGEPNTKKAWEAVAVILVNGRKKLRELEKSSNVKSKVRSVSFENLEKIPPHGVSSLTLEHYNIIKEYLEKAFSTSFHPLGKLIEGLVDVFRAAYIGIGAHPRLLFHALSEVQSFIKRLYHTVRILFPELPDKLGPTHVFREGSLKTGSKQVLERQISDEDANMEIITASLLIQPILLPKIYPALFDLYALNKDKEDEKYWQRVQKLNRQGDMALMSYLGADQKYWCLEDSVFAGERNWFSNVKDKCYTSAVEILQQISTAFCPQDKLEVIRKTCLQITQTIQSSIGEGHIWCMDDLFPVFQFVVIRAKIHHLGAEIQFIEDLMEPHLEFGELGLMFTTLKTCWSNVDY